MATEKKIEKSLIIPPHYRILVDVAVLSFSGLLYVCRHVYHGAYMVPSIPQGGAMLGL